MDKNAFLKWLKINTLFFVGAFIVGSLLAVLFPDHMLGFGRRWGASVIAISRTISEPVSRKGFFVNIVIFNSFTTFIKSLLSLIFLGPLLSIAMGVFYSIGLISAFERGVTPLWHSPVLIFIEVLFSLLAMSYASALGSEIFGVLPGKKEIIDFWKENWKKAIPTQKKDWKAVFKENKKEIILFIIMIFVLILVGAWVEILTI